MEIFLGLLVLVGMIVAGRLVARGVRAGWTGSPVSRNDRPTPTDDSNLTNWLAVETMRQAQSATPSGDASSARAQSFFGGDSSSGDSSNSNPSPQSDHSDPGGTSSYAGDPSGSGYGPADSGGGFGGGGGDAF
jgi:hypothetical protein